MADEPRNEEEAHNEAEVVEENVEPDVAESEPAEAEAEAVVSPTPETIRATKSQIKHLIDSVPPEELASLLPTHRLEVIQKFTSQTEEPEDSLDALQSKLTMAVSEMERLGEAAEGRDKPALTSTPRESTIEQPRTSSALRDRSSASSKRLSFSPSPSTSKEQEAVSKSSPSLDNLPQDFVLPRESAYSTKSSRKELNQATQRAIEMYRMIEDKTKRIELLKARYNQLNNKSCKTQNDIKHIKTFKCEVDCSFKRLEALLNEFKRLQPEVQGYPFPPIRLPTTLAEDSAPNVLGVQTMKPDYSKHQHESYVDDKRRSQPNLDTCQMIADDNMNLAAEQIKLQTEILERDRIIENLQHNLQVMQSEVIKNRNENCQKGTECPYLFEEQQSRLSQDPAMAGTSGKRKSRDSYRKIPVDVEEKLKVYKENTDVIEKNIARMARCLEQMQEHLTDLQKERDLCESNRSKGCRRINQLERELELTRKEANCRLRERESAMKTMENKIKILEANLEDAKRQISQLKVDILN